MDTEDKSANACSLCDLEFKNHFQLKQHLEGKKHKVIETIKIEREKDANRSIFVSGIKRDVFQKHLEEHFSQFGKINKVVQDQEKNAYAIIEYDNEDSVEKALAHQSDHMVNGKSLKVRKRQLKEFVCKLPNKTSKKLEVMDRIKSEALLVNKMLGKCHSFDEQIETLVNYLKLSENDLNQRNVILREMNILFDKYWNDNEFQLSIFGSTATHLAVKGSDMDLTILFTDYLPANELTQLKVPKIIHKGASTDGNDSNSFDHEEEMNSEDNYSEESDQNKMLKNAMTSFFNEKKYDTMLTFEIEHQIKVLAKILQRLDGMKQLRTIINTRVPVVRFFHQKASIFCDISINNYLAVANSKLIQLYTQLEPNLKNLLFIIRYWMKQKNLGSSVKFNGYVTTWMIVFYMQQRGICYLPTVQCLAEMTDKKQLVHGWNCAYETDINKIQKLRPKNSLNPSFNDLLKGFFEFYSKYEFNKNDRPLIISTCKAQVITTETPLTKVTGVFDMQDPFDLSHNISANISQKTLEHFIEECKGSNELLEYGKNPKKSENKCWGLILLMTKKILPLISATKTNSKSLTDQCTVNLKFLTNPSIINANDSSENFLKKSVEFILFVLKDCLLFEEINAPEVVAMKRKRLRILNQICDKVDSLGLTRSPKKLKTENGFSDTVDQDSDKESIISSYQFKINGSTWKGRRTVRRDLKQQTSQLNPYQVEKLISQKLADGNKQSDEDFICNIEFFCDNKLKESKNLKLLIELLNKSDTANIIKLTTLVHFLEDYLNNCYEKFYASWLTNTFQLLNK